MAKSSADRAPRRELASSVVAAGSLGSEPAERKPNGASGMGGAVSAASGLRLSETSTRLSITLKADGSLDLDAMRPATRERVLKAIASTKTPDTPADRQRQIAELEPLAAMACHALGLACVLGARLKGIPDRYAAMLAITETQQAQLAGPAARVLAKYSGALAYADEAILVTALVSTLAGNIQAMQQAIQRDTAGKPDAA